MRLRHRKDRAHGEFGRPLLEIDYANAHPGVRIPVAYMVNGATAEDCEYVLKWLSAVRSQGHSVDLFIPRGDP